jgi:hypothetical protein
MQRGRHEFNIHCAPCHGQQGDGKGVTSKLGMAAVANLHDARIVNLADGDLFNTITHGKNLMGGYAANIAIEDRWAVVAYLRAQDAHIARFIKAKRELIALMAEQRVCISSCAAPGLPSCALRSSTLFGFTNHNCSAVQTAEAVSRASVSITLRTVMILGTGGRPT